MDKAKIHPSHQPGPEKRFGITYCNKCGWMLWSRRRLSDGFHAYHPCTGPL